MAVACCDEREARRNPETQVCIVIVTEATEELVGGGYGMMRSA